MCCYLSFIGAAVWILMSQLCIHGVVENSGDNQPLEKKKKIKLKWILTATGSECVDRTDLVQDREELRAIVHIIMKLLDSQGTQNAENTLNR